MNQPTKTTPQEARRNRFALAILLILLMAGLLTWFATSYLGLTSGQYIPILIATIFYSTIHERLMKWASKI
jgi:hypothetical protein